MMSASGLTWDALASAIGLPVFRFTRPGLEGRLGSRSLG